MIAAIILPALVSACLFIIGELSRRKLKLGNEFSRKLIHILHGLTVIWWSFLLPDNFIIGFEIVFFAAMFAFRMVVKQWPGLGWMYQVKRMSYGEFFYPIGIIAALLVTNDSWVFIAAIAQLAITDSAAALVGKTWGKTNEYKVFGSTKSVAGTAAFVLTAMAIFLLILLPAHSFPVISFAVSILGLSVLLALVENLSIYGSDNLFLPFVTAVLLQAML